MTEEELAEEFADRARIVDENTRAGDDCISLVQDYEGNVIDIHQRIKTAYLAGYNKANEWHDLRKNPDDLPKENGEYWVCYADSVHVGHKGYELWLYMNGEWKYTAKVIAWCELPKFEGAENG